MEDHGSVNLAEKEHRMDVQRALTILFQFSHSYS